MAAIFEYHYSVSHPQTGRSLARREPVATVEEFARVFADLGGGQERVAMIAEALTEDAAPIWAEVTAGTVGHLALVISDFGDFAALSATLETDTLIWDNQGRKVEVAAH